MYVFCYFVSSVFILCELGYPFYLRQTSALCDAPFSQSGSMPITSYEKEMPELNVRSG
jgi:hypothetical protein